MLSSNPVYRSILPIEGGETDFGQASLVGEEDTMIHQEGGVQELAVTDFQAAEEGLDGEAEGAGKGSVVSQEWFTTKDDKTALQSQGKARKNNCSCCSVP